MGGGGGGREGGRESARTILKGCPLPTIATAALAAVSSFPCNELKCFGVYVCVRVRVSGKLELKGGAESKRDRENEGRQAGTNGGGKAGGREGVERRTCEVASRTASSACLISAVSSSPSKLWDTGTE